MEQDWVATDTSGCDLGDARLNRRLGSMLAALAERPGKSLPTAFQNWSNTKAAYIPVLCKQKHVGGRESDIYELNIYELNCLAEELATNFLVRSCVDHLAEDGAVARVTAATQSSGTHEVRFRDAKGKCGSHRRIRRPCLSCRPIF